MGKTLEEAPLLGGASMVKQDHTVLNGSNTIHNTIEKKESTASLVHNTRLNKRELLLRMLDEVGIIVVAILLRPGRSQHERILMVVNLAQPLRVKEVVGSRPVSDTASESSPVRVRCPNRIEATRTQTPNNNLAGVHIRSTGDVVQHTGEQTVWRIRVRRISRAIRRTGDLEDDCRPATRDDLLRALAVVRSIAVETRHEQHDGDRGASSGLCGSANVDRDAFAVERRTVGVRYGDFGDGWFPERSGLEVDLLLAVKGIPFDVFCVALVGVVNVWETRDSVYHCRTAKVFRCFFGLATLLCAFGLLLEVGSYRQEGVRVFIGGRIIDVVLIN